MPGGLWKMIQSHLISPKKWGKTWLCWGTVLVRIPTVQTDRVEINKDIMLSWYLPSRMSHFPVILLVGCDLLGFSMSKLCWDFLCFSCCLVLHACESLKSNPVLVPQSAASTVPTGEAGGQRLPPCWTSFSGQQQRHHDHQPPHQQCEPQCCCCCRRFKLEKTSRSGLWADFI